MVANPYKKAVSTEIVDNGKQNQQVLGVIIALRKKAKGKKWGEIPGLQVESFEMPYNTLLPDKIPSFEDTRMHLIQRKTKGNITREVYRYDQILVKRFLKTRMFPDVRPVWKWEDRALQRLAGLPVPATYGFSMQKLKGVLEIIFAREYVQGQPLDTFTLEDMISLGKIMAQIHQRGIITRDPAPNNFIKTPNEDIMCIDFGRAALLNPQNPVLWYYVGKEMARLRYHALSGDKELYRRFQEGYYEAYPAGPLCRWLINRVSCLWYRRFTRKHSRPQK